MSPRQHCDEILRLIDEVLGEGTDPADEPAPRDPTPVSLVRAGS